MIRTVFTAQIFQIGAGLSGYVAELACPPVCAALGIQGELRHAGYIESWLTQPYRRRPGKAAHPSRPDMIPTELVGSGLMLMRFRSPAVHGMVVAREKATLDRRMGVADHGASSAGRRHIANFCEGGSSVPRDGKFNLGKT